MDLGDSSVGALFTTNFHPSSQNEEFGHPAHYAFTQAVGADPIVLEKPGSSVVSGTTLEGLVTNVTFDIPSKDVYITENSQSIYTIPLLMQQHPDAMWICINADHRLYGTGAYAFTDSFRSKIRYIDRYLDAVLLRKILREYADGVIAGSSFVREFTEPHISSGTPIETVTPFIQPKTFESLRGLQPDLNSNTAVVIGTALDYKGIDRLVEIWPRVRQRHPDASLKIIGPGHPDRYARVTGVTRHGFVELTDLRTILSKCSLYVHPARAEAFGVTVVEAMLAGLPAVVTRTTGSRDAAKALATDLRTCVSGMDELVDAICAYFSTALHTRKQLSDDARRIGRAYNRSDKVEHFVTVFESMLEANELSS